jgi:hypothetical protein
MKWKSSDQTPEQGRQLMKRFFAMLMSAGALGLLVFAQTAAQELKHFAAKGLSFDYPATIELDDRSSFNDQHLVIQSAGRAQIMIVSRYAQITSAEQFAAARHEIVDSFIETMWQQIHDQDPNVLRTPAQIEVAGAQATGVRLRAVLNNQPGNAEVYSLQLGPRLVLLSLIGTDIEIAATAPVWLAIRHSLKIEASTNHAVVARESAAADHLIGSRASSNPTS